MSSSRFVVVSALCAVLALIGSVAAKPAVQKPLEPKLTKGVTLEGVDPVFASQLAPRPLGNGEALALKNSAKGPADAPKFMNKRLASEQRLRILGADDNTSLPDARVFDAQNLYHDAEHWMNAGTARIGAMVYPQQNYIAFANTDPAFAGGAGAVIQIRGETGTRYVLECNLEAGASGTTFSARGPAGEFSVTSDARATLLLVHDANVNGPVNFDIGASQSPWYLEACELSSYRR